MAPRDALNALAEFNLKELHLIKRSDGSRNVDLLCDKFLSAGLVPSNLRGSGDVRKVYCAIFDLALSHSFGCWIVDFVIEVCADRHLASDDPLEAQLLDGRLVADWSQSTLALMETDLVATLKNEVAFLDFVNTGKLERELGRCNALINILRTLDSISQGSMTAPSVAKDVTQAQLLLSSFQAMLWCARHQVHLQSNTGTFASIPEWLQRVQSRREQRRSKGLFLDDMLTGLVIGGVYPFSSLQNALFMLFITIRDVGSAEEFASTFSLPLYLVHMWQAQYLLDCVVGPAGSAAAAAELSGEATPLQLASQLLSGSVQPDTPFKFIEVLAEVGAPEVALGVHRAQVGGSSSSQSRGGNSNDGDMEQEQQNEVSLPQALTLLDLRLRCGLLAESFLWMRSHLESRPPATRVSHPVLILTLANWAVVSSSQDAAPGLPKRSWATDLLELPFTGQEEEVLVCWLVSCTIKYKSTSTPKLQNASTFFVNGFKNKFLAKKSSPGLPKRSWAKRPVGET
eukprot:gene447-1848_t